MNYDVNKFNGLKAGAETFNSAHKALNAVMQAFQVQNPNHQSYFLISKIVNQALFCEIGLKALIVRDGNAYGKIHKLDKLFGSLNQDAQTDIIAKTGLDKNTFDKLIVNNNDVFVNWRYFFEGNATCNPEFMDKFSDAIFNVLHSKNR